MALTTPRTPRESLASRPASGTGAEEGTRLRALRHELGMSVAEGAKALHIGALEMLDVENGRREFVHPEGLSVAEGKLRQMAEFRRRKAARG